MHADEVVCVHYSVNKSVQQYGQKNATVIIRFGIKPVKEENSCVVVHMKERELFPLFANHNEDGVPEIPNFAYVENVEEVSNRRVRCIVRHAKCIPLITSAVRNKKSLNRHVCA
mmetsp:Transcript_6483/g.14008  ORF Transcript_6483/g.14008 Transcript_6483/m.14008 type:complete len:114 (+) Transcript_6483:510-851(+)